MDQADDSQDGIRGNKAVPSTYYEILVEGQLDHSWSEWFEGLEVTSDEKGETLIAGLIPDQAALQGILTKVFNLRLPLLSLRRISPK